MKVVLKVIVIIFLILVVVAGLGMLYISRGLEEGLNVSINPINLHEVEDGVYQGNYDFGRWTNIINVTVNSHKITNIEIKDDMVFVKPEMRKELLDRVINEQNTTVDVVSGATVSCKAYLKSIENAFNK
jgi:uncharacterized protein with FMN-binding domain